MQKKLLCFLSAILLVFNSCSNDDSHIAENTILPKTITYKDGNNKIYQTTTFTYDDNKIIGISGENFYINFIYEGNQIVKEIQYRDFGEGYSEKSYRYSNDSLKSVTKLLNGKETRFLYSNNGDGTIKKETYKVDDKTGKESKSDGDDMLIFANGNLIKTVSNWGYLPYITTCRYDYDNNISAFKNVLGLNLLLDQDLFPVNFDMKINISSANNIMKNNVFTNPEPGSVLKPDEGIVFEPFLYNMHYEYNKKGYPTKKTTYDYTGEITEIIEYTY